MLRKGSGKKKAFIAAYRATASLTKAADAAGVDRRQHYRWMELDGAYASAFEIARDEAAQTLEDEAVRRAHEGVLEAVFYQGKPVGAERVYSDALLMFLLRGLRPEKYRDRGSVEVTGVGGGPIELMARLNAGRQRVAQRAK